MDKLDLEKVKNIYIVGIGGIGISALARMFLKEGKKVFGNDYTDSPIIEGLRKIGISVTVGQGKDLIPQNADLIIYTIALEQSDSNLLSYIRTLPIPSISYPEALGLISEDKFTIAVSGTHGKTTTTAMIAKIMIDTGLSPTVVAGSLLTEYQSNFVAGKSDFFLVEACEYRRSFLNLNPNILIITNIDRDHLDYYKNLADIQSAFRELARKLKPEDFLICDINDPNLQTIIEDKRVECHIIDYPSISAEIILKIPGRHNEMDAKAALASATVLEIQNREAVNSLKNFKGTWRRLEKRGVIKKGAIIFDDYAHHPVEIKATLSSLLEMFPDKKIVVVFQPHLYSRTKLLKKEFSESFKGASEVVLAPIYAAREKEDKSISSLILASEIKKTGLKAKNFSNFSEISDYLVKNFDSRYIIATMGAGDIYKLAELIAD